MTFLPHTQELLNAARMGDASARNELLERHREALRRIVGQRMDPKLRPRLDASDIVQDVLIEADRRLTEYLRASRMPFQLWLRHLAQDRLIDLRRYHGAARRNIDRQRAFSVPVDRDTASQFSDDPAAADLTPAAAAIHVELEQRFQEAVDKLDALDREVILLRHFEQLTNRDTAEMLQLSEAAAAMRYLRAMRRLRSLLHEGEGPGLQ